MPKTVQLNESELELVNQLSNAAQSVQSQLNTAIAMAMASRGVKNYQITAADQGRITYTDADDKPATPPTTDEFVAPLPA